MRSLIRLLRKSEKGSVAVEFALFLPLLLMFIFSIIELGAAWYTKQMLVSASREGARIGILYNDTGSATNQSVANQVLNILAQSGLPGTPTVNVSGVTGGTTGGLVTVTIAHNYTFPVLSNLVPNVLSSMTLTSTTVMRHE